MATNSEPRILLPRRPERISIGDLLLVAIATRELLLARARYARLPIGDILHGLRRPAMASSRVALEPAHAVRIGWAIAAAARRVPWRADCVLQAMAADRWLRRLGATPELTIGVEKNAAGGLAAHAWLRCNGVTVTGGAEGLFAPLLEPQAGADDAPRDLHAANQERARHGMSRRQA